MKLNKLLAIPTALTATIAPAIVLSSCGNKDTTVTIDWNTEFSGTQLSASQGPLTAAQATELYFNNITTDNNVLLNDIKMQMQWRAKKLSLDKSKCAGSMKYTLKDLTIDKEKHTLSYTYSMTANYTYYVSSTKHEINYNHSISVKNKKYKVAIWSTAFNYDWCLIHDSSQDWSACDISGTLNGSHKENDAEIEGETWNNFPFTCSNASDWNTYGKEAAPWISCWSLQNIERSQ